MVNKNIYKPAVVAEWSKALSQIQVERMPHFSFIKVAMLKGNKFFNLVNRHPAQGCQSDFALDLLIDLPARNALKSLSIILVCSPLE